MDNDILSRSYLKQQKKLLKKKRALAKVNAQIASVEAGDYKKISTSKLVLLIVLIVSFFLDFVIIYGWMHGMEEAGSMILANEGAKGITIGFYEWKAKNENMVKFKQQKSQIETSFNEEGDINDGME